MAAMSLPRFATAASLLVAGASACWGGSMTPEACCVGPQGNADCWDEEYTFERCCGTGGEAKASDAVESLKIDPKSVPRLPLLGGGRMPISGIGMCCRPTASGDPARQAVVDYLSMGGRHLDTAQLYNNHREIGLGLRQGVAMGIPREDIFLTTKIWPSDFGFESAHEWVDRMLMELGVDYVDLVLLHAAKIDDAAQRECGNPKQCRQETWMALQRAHSSGKIKNLGVSNFGQRQMEELIGLKGAPITANQFEYHPWVPKKHRETAEWCHQHGIAVTAYGSMGSAGLAQQMVGQEALKSIGSQYGKSAGQVLLRWAVQKNVSVIPGTSNPKHMAENIRLFDFELSANDLAMLDNIPEDQHMLHFGHTPDEAP